MGGWSNDSGKVKTYKMSENKMGNRGSKSNGASLFIILLPYWIFILHSFVKEQRADSSYCALINYTEVWLRYALMELERVYQFKIHAKWFSKYYSNKPLKKVVDNSFQWFITGFTDAEGSFGIGVFKTTGRKLGWKVALTFTIGVHKKDLPLLQKIQAFLKVGKIYKSGNEVYFKVTDKVGLKVIVEHFLKFSFISYKSIDFPIFKEVFLMVLAGSHLTKEGLEKIVVLKANQNKGLNSELFTAFPMLL